MTRLGEGRRAISNNREIDMDQPRGKESCLPSEKGTGSAEIFLFEIASIFRSRELVL